MDPQNCNFESLAHVFFLFLSISDSKHVAEWSSEGHSLHEWMPSDTPAGFLESMESAFRNSRCFILAFTMLYDSWRRLICGLVCFKRNWTQPSMILIITLCLYRKKHISGWWFNNPSEKYELVSWDDDIPKIWKVIKVMFQTTNQILMNISMVFDTSRAVTWDQTIRGGDVESL